MSCIRDFKELSKVDVALAGGKGASLGEMTQAGILVPPGFVVTAQAFDEFLKKTDLTVEIDSILHAVDHAVIHTVEDASERIKSLIVSAEMPQAIITEIQQSFKKLDAKYVAVRSSATSEDSADAAWAGQLESYLNTVAVDLIENVKKCWASLFTPRAIFYRFEKGLHGKPIFVAVVVQKMIQSEVSGIAFSVHPVTQDYDQLIIEAGFGLGEAIVSGSITPDSFVIEKSKGKILDKNITIQTRGLFGKKEGGNEWRDIPPDEGKKPTLTNKEVLDLTKFIMMIEKHYGFPVDVEWAREKGKFYIVQSRPVTTLRSKKAQSQESGSLDIGDYQRLFKFDDFVPFVLGHDFVCGYTELGGLALNHDHVWFSYMRQTALQKTLPAGLELYKDRGEYTAYTKQLYQVFASIEHAVKVMEKTKTLTQEQVQTLVSVFRDYRKLYLKTEFFYTDLAFEKRKEFPTIEENFKSFAQFKLDGREYLNRAFFLPDSLLSHLLKKVAAQFNIPYQELLAYSLEEIIDLFDEKRVTKDVLKDRQKAYVVFAVNNDIHSLVGDEAKKFIQDALKEKAYSSILMGKIANKGKVTATAKVIKISLSDYDKLSNVIDKMKQGQILVAETTEPAIIAACKKASAIITNQGGMMSHAAIVSREMNIPCIVGTGNATDIIGDGDTVEVDADSGIVRILDRTYA